MKKVLILVAMAVWTINLSAASLCKKSNDKSCTSQANSDDSCAWVASHTWNSTNNFGNSAYVYSNDNNSADGTWCVTPTGTSAGAISGQSRCAANNSTNPPVADSTSAGSYCWCRVTSIVDSTNNKTCPANSNDAPWVFYGILSPPYCRSDCSAFCAVCVRNGTNGTNCSRPALLTIPLSFDAPALTCPAGSIMIDDYNYVVACEDTCPAGYEKITDDPAIIKFEAANCDNKGESTTTCAAP